MKLLNTSEHPLIFSEILAMFALLPAFRRFRFPAFSGGYSSERIGICSTVYIINSFTKIDHYLLI